MCLPFSDLRDIERNHKQTETEKLLSVTFQPNIHWCQQTVRHKLQLKKIFPGRALPLLSNTVDSLPENS